jgi:hypothetical protein
MKKCFIGLLLTVLCSTSYSSEQKIYVYEGMSVSVFLDDHETIEKAVKRAESMLQINAVTMTPKFVTYNTHYDSRTGEIVETGLIAQGANVSVLNTKHVREVQGEKIILNVMADVTVDVTAMLTKLGSEKREKLLESTIDDLTGEYRKLSTVLEKMKRNITLSNLDSLVVTDYYAALNSSYSVIDGDAITEQLRAQKGEATKLKAEVIEAYRMYVFPFMANPIIDYQVIDIVTHEHDVAEIKLKITINRNGDYDSAWYPSFSNGATVELCEQFFFGCKGLIFSENKQVNVKEVLTPKFCGDSLFEFLPYIAPGAKSFSDEVKQISCGSSKKFAYKNMAFYQTGYTNNLQPAQTPSSSTVFTEAFQELSKTSFWLKINVGSEKFKINISNILIDEVIVSAYMPAAEAVKGLKVRFRVEEEIFQSGSYKWTDTVGKFLRFQSRRVGFY